MLEIYHGDGKGKTTAGVGLCLRAAGAGFSVWFFQFMKDGTSAEIPMLSKIDGIHVVYSDVFFGFTKNMTQEQKQQMKEQYKKMLQKAEEIAKNSEKETLIVLDEVLHACNQKLLDQKVLRKFLAIYKDQIEIVLTGRNPSKDLMDLSDYISEVKKQKHPYDRGITARKGIEF